MIFVPQARSILGKCPPETVERFAEDFDLTFNKKDGTEQDLPALPTGLIRLKGINSQICCTRQRKPASECQLLSDRGRFFAFSDQKSRAPFTSN